MDVSIIKYFEFNETNRLSKVIKCREPNNNDDAKNKIEIILTLLKSYIYIT